VCFLIFTVLPIFSASVLPYFIHCRAIFPRPHRVELLTRPSMYEVYLHVIGFIFLYFYCFACNKSCLDQLALGCDVWSRSLNCGCERYPGFRVEEDKCWPGVPSPQCQEISVGLGFSALSVKE
jgi:hypothetical protein